MIATPDAPTRALCAAVAFLAIGLPACSEPRAGLVDLGRSQGERALILSASVPDSETGYFRVAIETDGLAAVGMDAELFWSEASLEYRGQLPTTGTATVVNDSLTHAGRLRMTMLDPLDRSDQESVFAFRSRDGDVPTSLRLVVHRFVTGDQGVQEVSVLYRHGARSEPRGEANPQRLSWLDWGPILDPDFEHDEAARPAAVPGEGSIFGDPTLDGLVNVLDGLYTANVSVGNTAIAECIVSTDDPSRDCVAANVRPVNAPGLGEVGDPCAPGEDVCSEEGRSIDVLDALAISQESVGLDQPIVGEPIPGGVFTPSDTVTLSGTVTGERVLAADTVYVLSGTVEVGDDQGSAGVLAIAAGTRLASLPGARLRITRNGRVRAEGTQFEPIVFSCFGSPSPGCWGGLIIDGNATINEGTPTSPALAGRTVAGCAESSTDAGAFGGCADADSSGVLRFVRLQYAGFGGAALMLRGVGSGTALEQIYVSSSSGIGVAIEGGTARIKRLRVTAAGSVGLDWTAGWRGVLQFGIVQSVSSGLTALRGRNSPSNPDATPRSAPVLRNITLVGPPDPGGQGEGTGGVILEAGSDAILRSFLVVAQPRPESHLLDVNGASTWARLNVGGIHFDSSFIAGYGRLGALDPDPATTAGYFSPDAEGQFLKDTAQANTFVMAPTAVDSVLRAAWASVPDLRPNPFGGAASLLSGCPSPEAGDSFFEDAPFCGAVAPPSTALSRIPWFEPAPLFDMTATPLAPAPGLLVIVVEAVSGSGPTSEVAGVTVAGATVTTTGITGLDGTYRSYTPSGGSQWSLTTLPPGCFYPNTLTIATGPGPGAVFAARDTIIC